MAQIPHVDIKGITPSKCESFWQIEGIKKKVFPAAAAAADRGYYKREKQENLLLIRLIYYVHNFTCNLIELKRTAL